MHKKLIGHPSDYQSLHHIYGQKPSQYQHAIRQIGNIVSVYDSDQKFPVWGFGSHFSNVLVGGQYWNGVKHDFNLNFNPSDPEVSGVFGIEQTYLSRKAHRIATVAHNEFIKNKNNKLQPISYFILLIITDGIINDMKQTKDEVVAISNYKWYIN